MLVIFLPEHKNGKCQNERHQNVCECSQRSMKAECSVADGERLNYEQAKKAEEQGRVHMNSWCDRGLKVGKLG